MFNNEINDLILKRNAMDDNDPRLEKCWEEITVILTRNEEDTIMFLEKATEEEVLCVSEVFEDVAYELQSRKYIDCLEMLLLKYPNIPIVESVDIAKRMMK